MVALRSLMELHYCPKRAKVGYKTAKEAAKAKKGTGRTGLDIYLCKNCRMYHLGRPGNRARKPNIYNRAALKQELFFL